MKPHDILKVKNVVVESMNYVTEYNICSFDICKYPVFISEKCVTKLYPEMVIWSVSVDHNPYCHDAQIRFL